MIVGKKVFNVPYNYTLGQGTEKQAMAMGEIWTSEGRRVSKDGVAWINAKNNRQFRPKAYKNDSGKWVANFEKRRDSASRWETNGHFIIIISVS